MARTMPSGSTRKSAQCASMSSIQFRNISYETSPVSVGSIAFIASTKCRRFSLDNNNARRQHAKKHVRVRLRLPLAQLHVSEVVLRVYY